MNLQKFIGFSQAKGHNKKISCVKNVINPFGEEIMFIIYLLHDPL